MSVLYDRPHLYDLLCPRLPVHAPEVRFYRGLARAGAGVLELGCGTGRLTIPLALSGVGPIVAVDLSAPMLAAARATAEACHALDPIEWVLGDMLRPPLGERRFGLVFCGLNTFLHLHSRAEQEAFFRAVTKHLAPGGVLALSVVNPDVRTYARPLGHRVDLLAVPVPDPAQDGAMLSIEETVSYDLATQTSGGQLHFSYPDHRDFFVADVNLRAVYPQELLGLLHYNGFEVSARYGDFQGRAFSSASPWQNVVCRLARTEV